MKPYKNTGGPYHKMNILIGKFIGANKRKLTMFRKERNRYSDETPSYANCDKAMWGYQCKIETLSNLKAAVIAMCTAEWNPATVRIPRRRKSSTKGELK